MIKKFSDFTEDKKMEEGFNPSLFVPGIINMMKKKPSEETPVTKGSICPYRKVTVGEFIRFKYNDTQYKLDYDTKDFHKLLDVGREIYVTDYLCRYIGDNEDRWVEDEDE